MRNVFSLVVSTSFSIANGGFLYVALAKTPSKLLPSVGENNPLDSVDTPRESLCGELNEASVLEPEAVRELILSPRRGLNVAGECVPESPKLLGVSWLFSNVTDVRVAEAASAIELVMLETVELIHPSRLTTCGGFNGDFGDEIPCSAWAASSCRDNVLIVSVCARTVKLSCVKAVCMCTKASSSKYLVELNRKRSMDSTIAISSSI
mmetsp:Transcript_9699/g.17877  ORF Transcript_9699/g.17877 Transcript_9699/m.17877 type:complete len:207 (-) Transcript_9699:111-731(-)